MQLIDVIKETLQSLRSKNIVATPSNYAKEFNTIIETLDDNNEDILQFKEKLKRLSRTELHKFHNNNANTHAELTDILLDRVTDSELKKVVNSLREILRPSIYQNFENEYDELLSHLFLYPHELVENNTLDKLKNITHKRIDLDKGILKNKTDDMGKFSSLISKYIDRSIDTSNDINNIVNEIKVDLDSLNISNVSKRDLNKLHTSLIDKIVSLQKKINLQDDNLNQSKKNVANFNDEINALIDLSNIKVDNGTDALTKLPNKKVLSVITKKIDAAYKLFNINYAVVFFDIDNFKFINDNEGTECGDIVLKTFATALNRLTRSDDQIIRYEEDCFISIINIQENFEIEKYLQRIKERILKSKFIYKDKRIKITFCAGVAIRSNYSTHEDAEESAFNQLFKAKDTSTNKVLFDNGFEF